MIHIIIVIITVILFLGLLELSNIAVNINNTKIKNIEDYLAEYLDYEQIQYVYKQTYLHKNEIIGEWKSIKYGKMNFKDKKDEVYKYILNNFVDESWEFPTNCNIAAAILTLSIELELINKNNK